MKNEDESARGYAQEKINELKGLAVSDQFVIRMDTNKVEGSGKNILSKLDLQSILDSDGDITKTRMQKLTRSTNPNDRHYAAELLLHMSKDECTSFLMELLNDSEPKVRNAAIKTSVKKYNTEVINAIIENLGNPVFSNQAMNALVLIGADTLTTLDAHFIEAGKARK